MTTAIHQEITFKAPPHVLFDAFVNARTHSEFTGATAHIEAVAGSAFSVYGGGAEGRQIELVEGARIVQAWRGADWPAGVYSLVRLEFRPQEGGTCLVLDHTSFPEGADAHLEAGWHNMYWTPLQTWLEKQ